MEAVPSCSMLSRFTRPMVVGPFRPAMRRASVVDSSWAASLEAASEDAASLEAAAELETAELALPPQAARHSARLRASSRDTNFFIIWGPSSFLTARAMPSPARRRVVFLNFTRQFSKNICFARLSLL